MFRIGKLPSNLINGKFILINQTVFVNKSSFYRALIWGLAAIVPYIACIGFHLSRKDDKVQKVHLVYEEKAVNREIYG